jgi:hypothetical protein
VLDPNSLTVTDFLGTTSWFANNMLHRTDGPAIEFQNGYQEWWLNGSWLSFEHWLDKNPEMTDEEKVMYKLQYG